MPLASFDQAKVDNFFADTAPFADAYRYVELRYMAVRGKADFPLILGAVELSAFRPAVVRDAFNTADAICVSRDLRDLALDPKALIRALLSGELALPGGPFAFPPDQGGHHRAHYWPFDGSAVDVRLAPGHLVISGASNSYIYLQQTDLYRQLKHSDGAYESPVELAADFGLKLDMNASIKFDFLADRVAEIAEESELDGDHLVVRLQLAGVLDPSRVKLSVVIADRDGATARLPAARDGIAWARETDCDWSGTFELSRADMSSVRCMLSYASLVQDQATLTQPLHRINTLRFVHDLYDPQAKGIEKLLRKQKVQGRDPQLFEHAVAALLAMRGFALASLDRIPGLNETPDILAADRRGNILVVECTLDPNGDNKIGQASRKAIAIRQAFAECGREDIAILAVMATPLSADDISGYLGDAQKQGVLLWSRTELDALRQDKSQADADAFFDGLLSTHAMIGLLGNVNDMPGDPDLAG